MYLLNYDISLHFMSVWTDFSSGSMPFVSSPLPLEFSYPLLQQSTDPCESGAGGTEVSPAASSFVVVVDGDDAWAACLLSNFRFPLILRAALSEAAHVLVFTSLYPMFSDCTQSTLPWNNLQTMWCNAFTFVAPFNCTEPQVANPNLVY